MALWVTPVPGAQHVSLLSTVRFQRARLVRGVEDAGTVVSDDMDDVPCPLCDQGRLENLYFTSRVGLTDYIGGYHCRTRLRRASVCSPL